MKAELFPGRAAREVHDAMHPSSAGLVIESLRNEHSSVRLPHVGELGFYSDVSEGGTPCVLVHSIREGASSHEMLPLFHAMRATRATYAVDMPGHGSSPDSHAVDRNDCRDALRAFITYVITESGRAPDVVERKADVLRVIEAFYEDRRLYAHERESRPSVPPLSGQPELWMSAQAQQRAFPRDSARPVPAESPDKDD